MTQQLVTIAETDHIRQWLAFKRHYIRLRGSDPGQFRKAVPRTTNGDVKQLAEWWHKEMLAVVSAHTNVRDSDKASRKRWTKAKQRIDRELAGASPTAMYRDNEWFWQTETVRLAQYLESLKVIPSRLTLAKEALAEVVDERLQDMDRAGEALEKVAGAGDRFLSKLKGAAIVAGGVLGVSALIGLAVSIGRHQGRKNATEQ